MIDARCMRCGNPGADLCEECKSALDEEQEAQAEPAAPETQDSAHSEQSREDHTAQVLAIAARQSERYHEAMVELAKGPDASPAEAESQDRRGRHLQEQANQLIAKVKRLEAERDVWSGKACQEEQEAGSGPCGACRHCLPGIHREMQAKLDAAQAEIERLRNDFPSVTEAEWDAARAREREEDTHPCDHYSAATCFCQGACSCHWVSQFDVQRMRETESGLRVRLELYNLYVVDDDGNTAWCNDCDAEAPTPDVAAIRHKATCPYMLNMRALGHPVLSNGEGAQP